MRITHALAQPIVNRLMEIVSYNVNIMNDAGVIVATGQPHRLNERHQAAKLVLTRGEDVVVEAADVDRLEGTQIGVNLPISFHREVVGVVGITGNPSEIYSFAKLVKMTAELLLEQSFLSLQQAYRERALDAWVAELVAPDKPQMADLEATATSLHIDTQLPRSVCLIQLRKDVNDRHQIPTDAELQDASERILRALPAETIVSRALPDALWIGWPQATGTMQAEVASQFWVELLSKTSTPPLVCAIGHAYEGVRGYRLSHTQAVRTLKLLQSDGAQMVLHADAVQPERLTDSLEEDFLRELDINYREAWMTLGGLEKETLKTFYQLGGNQVSTAKALHIHRNTLSYRLDRIKRIVGLDPRDIRASFILFTLLTQIGD